MVNNFLFYIENLKIQMKIMLLSPIMCVCVCGVCVHFFKIIVGMNHLGKHPIK